MIEKQFKNLDEQLEIFKHKGMIINDENYTKRVLLRENYFFLNGYRHLFLVSETDRVFKPGTTFEENALIKARAVCKLTGQLTMADDSGLEIDYLNKEPGVYSARYMGEDTPYTIKNQAIIDRLEGVPKEQRSARFVAAIAAVLPSKEVLVTRQTMEGYIGWEAQGENGFGYDPIFYPEGFDCSSASISPEEKNAISHRGKALAGIKKLLRKYF